ncbi:MAG: alpha-amylase family glycosyl hydrolase [Trueperaceae bacterium]
MSEGSARGLWWQWGIVYQIYPRSFQDSNGDGVGDLAGISSRLDYLEWLGVDAIWLSPIYPSPMADFGYDVSDYTAVHPLFGSMADFESLLGEAHRRNLRVIMDFVPNHTSEEHPWFRSARSSRDDPKRDWFMWRDPAPGGGPPNNWLSVFGGRAWSFDETTGQYYYHAYLPEQPDLNWRNPEVREAMLAAMRFWLDKGVDGFRVDVMWHLIKDEHFRDNPVNPDYRNGMPTYHQQVPAFSVDQPEVHEVVAEMRRLVDEYRDRVLIGEIYLPIPQLVAYYGRSDQPGAHLPFNFQLITLPWDAREISVAIDRYEGELPEEAWPNWVLGNHDKSRIASRVGPAQARVATMLLLTLRGTPTMYYGDEIAMQDVDVPTDRVQDPNERRNPGLRMGRDPVRTPMQWTGRPGAGFSDAEPWLPLAHDYAEANVEAQRGEPDSHLSLTRRLIALRRAEPALSLGEYYPVNADEPVLAFVREFQGERFLIALNLSGKKADLAEDESSRRYGWHGEVVCCTHANRERRRVAGRVPLVADEGVVVRLEPASPAT